MDVNEITGAIVNSAMKVHSLLGPGLLEEPYKVALRHELTLRGYRAEIEFPMPVVYDGVRIDLGYRLDLYVERQVIVELKAVIALKPIHRAQLLSYLKLRGNKVGLLINFHVPSLKEGIIRLAN